MTASRSSSHNGRCKAERSLLADAIYCRSGMSRFQPPRPAEEPDRGVVLAAESPIAGRRLIPFVGVAGFILVFFLISGAGLGFFVFIGLVAGAALAVVYSSSIVAAFDWQSASLEIPNRQILLGDDIAAVFRRSSRRKRKIAEFSVQGTLVCEEEVKYRQGTDTRTDRHRPFQRTFVAHLVDSPTQDTIGGHTPPAMLTATLALKVPDDAGGPTLELPNNRVRWYLEVNTAGPGAPNDVQRFTLVVTPRLAPDVQDDRPNR